MQYKIETSSESCIVLLTGEFTFSDNAAFRSLLASLAQIAPTFLIIDFAQTPFIDSAALGMLLLLREELRQKVNLIVLRKAQTQVRKMFELSKFNTLFSLED